MRVICSVVLALILFAVPVAAIDLEAPAAPESVIEIIPDTSKSLGQGILSVLRDAAAYAYPDLKECGAVCLCLIVICVIFSLLQALTEMSQMAATITGVSAITLVLLKASNSLINLSLTTVQEISEYSKLLFPLLAASLAAQGGVTASTQLYAATAVLTTVLSSAISVVLKPAICVFLALSIASCAFPEKVLKTCRDFCKNTLIWIIKIILYVFTGYISITGVISGTTDAMALRATKITISGVVPVVGGILSDASEAILVSAGMVKNAIGIYGLFVIMALQLRPFIQIGVHYLLLKMTAALCSAMNTDSLSRLIESFSDAMGILLAVSGATGLMLMVSIICFLKGAG